MFRRSYRVERAGPGRYSDWEQMESVLLSFARELKVDILVSVPHCEKSKTEQEKGVLFIKLYACPYFDGASTRTLPSAYGYDLGSNQEDGMEPSRTLETVYDQNGVVVAEFTQGCIFVLFDLPHGNNSGELMRLIMEDYKLFSTSPEAYNEMMWKRIEQFSEQNFFEIYSEGLSDQVEFLANQISDLDDSLIEYRKEIIKKNRERIKLIDRKRVVESLNEQTSREIVTKKLIELKRFAVGGPVKVEDDSITIPVGQIDIEYEGETYDIGVFEIVLFPDGDHGGVRCFNKTRTINEDYFHPHVYHDGDCCLGNISDTVAELIGKAEYELVVILMLQFLRTCNDDGWYEDVEEWPNKNGEAKDEDDSC